MTTHSRVLAQRIPGTEEPGGLPSMVSHRVGHDCSDLAAAVMQPTPVLLPGKSCGRRSVAGYTVHGVAKSRTRLSDFTSLYNSIDQTHGHYTIRY